MHCHWKIRNCILLVLVFGLHDWGIQFRCIVVCCWQWIWQSSCQCIFFTQRNPVRHSNFITGLRYHMEYVRYVPKNSWYWFYIFLHGIGWSVCVAIGVGSVGLKAPVLRVVLADDLGLDKQVLVFSVVLAVTHMVWCIVVVFNNHDWCFWFGCLWCVVDNGFGNAATNLFRGTQRNPLRHSNSPSRYYLEYVLVKVPKFFW